MFWVGLCGLGVVMLLTLVTEVRTRDSLKKANQAALKSNAFADESVRNRETVLGLKMQFSIAKSWLLARKDSLLLQAFASDRGVVFSSAAKFFRMLMQSSMLCFGSYLVIQQEMTAGGMIAASIILGRALQPVEQLVNTWKQFQGARSAIMRVDRLLASLPLAERKTKLPAPEGRLSVERTVFSTARDAPPILKGVSFDLLLGECLSVIGPSGAGKTTLLRLLVGANKPLGGIIRLDQSDLATWNAEQLQRSVGYLSQDVVLFPGTIRQNIARFAEAEDEEVVAAAQAANAHDLIVRLPNGYNTLILDSGTQLSGGQRQRIGLARALFGDPVLIVLDEPNAHLDTEGEQALARTLQALKERRRAIVLVSHRGSTLALSDKIMLLRNGTVEVFGPAAEVIAKLQKATASVPVAVPG